MPYYLEWSTVCNAPYSFGMPKTDFEEYWLLAYGARGLEELEQLMGQVAQSGTSHPWYTLDELLSLNRAGDYGEHISKDEIIRRFCLRENP